LTSGGAPSRELEGGYRIRVAARAELPRLDAIERAAAALFSERELPSRLRGTTGLAALEAGRRAGDLLVAENEAGEPVGFALLARLGDHAHLAELDVHPDHGRRGLGAALVAAAADRARAQGHTELTLTTFVDVAWNAPFYQRFGFEVVTPDTIDPPLRGLLDHESELGFDPARRVAMRLRLGPVG
jgi:GNAT superfamily N-acetyltransferase